MQTTCDVCGQDVTKPAAVKNWHKPNVIYDAKTIHGPWAWLCSNCFTECGVGLGTGKGQQYDTTTGQKLDG